MLTTDERLIITYKQLFGLDNIDNIVNDTIFKQNVTVQGINTINGNSIFDNNVTILSPLYVENNVHILNNTTLLSSLNVLNDVTSNNLLSTNISCGNNLTILSDLTVYNNITINTNLTSNTNLYSINGIIPEITLQSISTDNVLDFYSTNIIIGSSNSIISMIGTTTSVLTNELNIKDRLLTLNYNSTNNQAFDQGFLSGIQIQSENDIGYIKTSDDGKKFLIKAPNSSDINYIGVTEGTDESFSITGNVILKQYTSILSNIYISSTTNLNGSTTFMSALIVSGNSIFMGNTTMDSSLFIQNNSLIYGNTTIMNNFYVSGTTNIGGMSEINGSLNVLSDTNVKGTITVLSLLNVINPVTINNNVTVNSFFNVNNDATLNGTTTILSSISVSGTYRCYNDLQVFNTINVSNDTFVANTITLNSSMQVLGKTEFSDNITLKSNLSIFGNIINQLDEYPNNSSASNDNIPLWGLYRTGGIVKIRIPDILPILSLIGLTNINIYQGSNYVEPGVNGFDETSNSIINVYITKINNINTPSTNILSTPILLNNGNSTTINTTSYSVGIFTITYSGTNLSNYTNYTTRTLTINFNPVPIIELIGSTTISIVQDSNYIDPGVTGFDPINNTNILVYITSITNIIDPNTNLISSIIQLNQSSSTTITNTSTFSSGTFTIIYTTTNISNGFSNTISRTLNIISPVPYKVNITQNSFINSSIFNGSATIYNTTGIRITTSGASLLLLKSIFNNINFNGSWTIIIKMFVPFFLRFTTDTGTSNLSLFVHFLKYYSDIWEISSHIGWTTNRLLTNKFGDVLILLEFKRTNDGIFSISYYDYNNNNALITRIRSNNFVSFDNTNNDTLCPISIYMPGNFPIIYSIIYITNTTTLTPSNYDSYEASL